MAPRAKFHSIASPTLAHVGVMPPHGKPAMIGHDEEGRVHFVTDADQGFIVRFGVIGDHEGKALVVLERKNTDTLRLWIPVANLEILNAPKAPHHD